MDNLPISLVLAVFSSAVSILLTHQVTKNHYMDRIEVLAVQSDRYHRDLTTTQAQLSRIQPEFAQLREEHVALEVRYGRCTSSAGKTVSAHPLSSAWATTELRTGDEIEFKLSDSRVTIAVVRMTTDGAIVRVNGCLHPGTLEVIKSPLDGDNAFVVTLSQPLIITVSSDCCAKGLVMCDLSDIEEIRLELVSIDVDEQLSTVRYRKVLI